MFLTRSFSSLFALLLVPTLVAQSLRAPTTAVPHLVRINSTFQPASGARPRPVESAIFSIYAEETGGTPLWQETQIVSFDADGHYNVLLGSTRNEGLPADLFASGQSRWLGIQFQSSGDPEQARVLLASVPYALKASDAETLGGLPASAFLRDPAGDVSTSGAATLTRPAAPRFTSSGTTGSIAMFTDNAGDIGNSALFQNGLKVGLGTTNPVDYLHVAFTDTTGGVTGYAVQNLSGSASSFSGMLFYDNHGALGQFQGFNNSSHEYRINNIAKTDANFDGSINFMIGSNSKFLVRSDGDVDIPGSIRKSGTLFIHNLGSNTTSVGLGALQTATVATNGATAVGTSALANLISGNFNTAIGALAMEGNTGGAGNTAVGHSSLFSLINSSNNTAVGVAALAINAPGDNNTAVGAHALGGTTGSGNIALGSSAGGNISAGSNNIMIGNQGVSTDSGVMRLGDSTNQSKTFIGGIAGVAVAGASVLVSSSGQLGVASSSRRYKEDIQDMGDASTNLLRLRPVTYRYKQSYEDGSKPMDYGLVAEEVAEIYPDLVMRNKDGQVETVQYQKLAPMLLNELQKQNETIRWLENRVGELQSLIEKLLDAKGR